MDVQKTKNVEPTSKVSNKCAPTMNHYDEEKQKCNYCVTGMGRIGGGTHWFCHLPDQNGGSCKYTKHTGSRAEFVRHFVNHHQDTPFRMLCICLLSSFSWSILAKIYTLQKYIES